jgi:hypothetical protein
MATGRVCASAKEQKTIIKAIPNNERRIFIIPPSPQQKPSYLLSFWKRIEVRATPFA